MKSIARWVSALALVGSSVLGFGCSASADPLEPEMELVSIEQALRSAGPEGEPREVRVGCPTAKRAPDSGPGSEAYPHARAQTTTWKYGRGELENRVYIYSPDAPRVAKAPVVFYLPGYGGSSVGDLVYKAMLSDLARKGYVVVYITYGGVAEPWAYQDNVVTGMKQAITRLRARNSGLPQIDETKVAFMGHSLGTILSARVANRARALGVLTPSLLVFHDAEGWDAPTIRFVLPIDDLSGIGADTRMIFASAETSLTGNATNVTVSKLWQNARKVPASQKSIVVSRGDDHGCPALVSDHYGMLEGGSWKEDTIDFYGYRKPTEAALGWAFEQKHRDYLFGDTAVQRDMGVWSDGTPVKVALTTRDLVLAPIPR